MVFETLVVKVLNRFLGSFVENLDASQLKLGIFGGGNVTLGKLVLKQSALDDLGLPVKTIAGYVGKLMLKLPLTNIYTGPIIVTIEGLSLLAVPLQAVKYDGQKEEQELQDAKQRHLSAIELAKIKQDTPTDAAEDSLVEKIKASVLQRVQIVIKDIHLRYEDELTNAQYPMALGFTLSNLCIDTTDENWAPTIVQEITNRFFKLARLESLAFYWICDAELMSRLDPKALGEAFQRGIANSNRRPYEDSYVLGPITSFAQLSLNLKPEIDGSNYTIPKLLASLVIEELSIGLSKQQYGNIVKLLHSMMLMNRAAPYRKYRPELQEYKNHAREWWKFAITSVKEVEVARRLRNWRWSHMKQHRTTCKQYLQLYKYKLLAKSLTNEQQQQIDQCEKILDVFNITVVRRQAEVEAERSRIEKAKEDSAKKGWFGGWLSWGGKADNSHAEGLADEVAKMFQAEMSTVEKAKLFEVIGYEENATPAIYPKHFVENRIAFTLNRLSVLLHDTEDKTQPVILLVSLDKVEALVEQRPAAQAIKVATQVGEFVIEGSPNALQTPQLATSFQSTQSESLLDIIFETHPLGEICDQRLKLKALPLIVTYDAQTVNRVVDMFRAAPEASNLSQLQAAAKQKFEDLKEKSVTGLQYAIEKQPILDLNVDIAGSYILIPESGSYEKDKNLVAVNMGSLHFRSLTKTRNPSVSQMVRAGSTEGEILQEMMASSYDKFALELRDMQVLSLFGGEDWLKALQDKSYKSHMLRPLSIQLVLEKCLILDDPRLPITKISGSLPNLHLAIQDTRLINMGVIIRSIPLPSNPEAEAASAGPLAVSEDNEYTTNNALRRLEALDASLNPAPFSSPRSQLTQVQLSFDVNDVRLEYAVQGEQLVVFPLLEFHMVQLSSRLELKSWETHVGLSLTGLRLWYCPKPTEEDENLVNPEDRKVAIISTEGKGQSCLLTMDFLKVERQSPDFATKYEAVEQMLDVQLCDLDVNLQQEVLLSILQLSNDLSTRLEQIETDFESRNTARNVAENSEMKTSVNKAAEKLGAAKKKPVKMGPEGTHFLVRAQMSRLQASLGRQTRTLALVAFSGLNVEARLQPSKLTVTTRLKNVSVIDPNATLYPTIVGVVDENAFHAQFVLYNDATENEGYLDMESVDIAIKLATGRLKIVYLNKFIQDLLSFVDQFQAAKTAIIEASAQAAQAARQNVQEAYAKALRVALDIKMIAPLIYIPQTTSSCNILVADLGQLTLKNQFVMQGVRNEIGLPAILDLIDITLENLKLSRAITEGKDNHVKAECVLLHPISFELKVVRNLTASWYIGAPDLEIKICLGVVQAYLSEEDYAVAMGTLLDNLAEGVGAFDSSHTDGDVTLTPSLAVSQGQTPITDHSLPASSQDSTETVLSQVGVVRKTLTFVIVLDTMQLDLFAGSTDLVEGTVSHDKQKALAQVALKRLDLSGYMMSDNSMEADVVLTSIWLEDTRPTPKRAITRLLEPKWTATGSKAMIQVSYKKNALSEQDVNVKICGFTLILNLNYLLRLGAFFSGSHNSGSCAPASKPTEVKTGGEGGATEKGPGNQAILTVSVKMEKPDIILMENLENEENNVLILNTEADLKLLMIPDCVNLAGNILNLHIVSCAFRPEKRRDTTAEVLSPCSISVHASSTKDKATRVNVDISDVILSVSPGTIEMLSHISATLLPGAEETGPEVRVVPDYSDLWSIKAIPDLQLDFLAADVAEEALPVGVQSEAPFRPTIVEQLMLKLENFTFYLEVGRGNRTTPMILLESVLHGEIRNWSSLLEASLNLSLEMAYYNSNMALWEPLLEPVEHTVNSGVHRKPWELVLKLKKNPDVVIRTPSEEDFLISGDQEPPNMCISIEAADMVELTVTKTFLDVTTVLSEAFADAVKQQLSQKQVPAAPYLVRNDLDMDVFISLSQSDFKLTTQQKVSDVVLEPGAEVGLIPAAAKTRSVLREQEVHQDRTLALQIPALNYSHSIPVSRADRRYLPTTHRLERSGDMMGVVVDIVNEFGFRHITIRSIVKLVNHMKTFIDVYYMTKRGNELAGVGRLEGCGVLHMTTQSLYTPTGEIFFAPDNCSVSIVPFIWRDIRNKDGYMTATLQCVPKTNPEGEPFYLQVSGSMDYIHMEDTSRVRLNSTCYEIHVRPTAVLHNLLPIPVRTVPAGSWSEKEVLPGESLYLTSLNPGSGSLVLKILNYLDRDWLCKEAVSLNPKELSVWTFDSVEGSVKVSLDLGVHAVRKAGGTLHLSLYCPFWMSNRTGLLLSYRGEDQNVFHHPENLEEPILFSFKAKAFFGKKKASLRVEDSDWSDKFSLDVAGSSGTVTCRSLLCTYQVGIQISLCRSGLTKQITFLPYHVITNLAPFDLEVREADVEHYEWLALPSGQSVPFWPRSTGKKWIIFRVQDTEDETTPISYDHEKATLLQLDNKFGGIQVDFQISESSVMMTCESYQTGLAPVLVVNHSLNSSLEYREEGINTLGNLKPQQAAYYTWYDPNGPRKFVWKCGKKEIHDDLQKDDSGTVPLEDGAELRWVSFLSGRQRVLLITQEVSLAIELISGGHFERVAQEITISIMGVGLSLVDNLNHQEVVYIAITSSGVVWESSKKGKRFRAMSIKDCHVLEEAYTKYNQSKKVGKYVSGRQTLDGALEVDFEHMILHKSGEKDLKRIFQPGLWLQLQSSPHRRLVHARLNRLQIDNQLPDCVFPIVLAPVPPPKSVAAESVPKPLLELSVVERLAENSPVQQFQYLKLLVQELHFRADMALINGLADMFAVTSEMQSEKEMKENMEKDVMALVRDLKGHAALEFKHDTENYFGSLHLSPLKIHLSFSNTGKGTGKNPEGSRVFNVLLQSVGVTVTEVQDVVFRLAYFERSSTFMSWRQLMSELQWHYVGQAMKQLYVLVLGLDVIGNPFGLAVGFGKGVEQLFYEPFQGAIQGPGEFAEGLALGVRSLFGHTVSGAAGAISRITGTLGKGIAALTFDEDYQQKRRQNLVRRPQNIQENLAQGGKGLFMGFVEGVSGVITKPIEGAQQDGFEGFFKGAGKGLVGLVTRPTAGIVDFASGSFDAVKRVTEVSEEQAKLRPPRFLQPDGVVRPFSRLEAEGGALLREVEKGRLASTDHYVAHMNVKSGGGSEGKAILLITDRRVLLLSRHELFGQWQVEWGYTWDELSSTPEATKDGLFIPIQPSKKKVLGLFSSSETGKHVSLSTERATWMIRKMEDCMKTGTGQ